ncbi:glutathione S-transferase [Polychytrium aggregatum]|uniref:glutathione S-transferase n=1 Tax=Polychytrium aggregatum TaxID=110093 RepID=UPI0022FE82B8|nr:glutathione S-transferase [Polychytrium aggregatum]KAI9209104.1 glutathione S-transferase [Polychytrium aggregatum]
MSFAKPTSLKLTYFDVPGRAEPIRLSLFIAGIEFEDERLTREQFAAVKPTLPFGQVPVLTINGEHVVAQSKAILRYVGILGDQYPSTNDLHTTLLIDQVVEEVDDLWLKLLPSFLEADEAKRCEMRKKVAAEVYPPMLAGLDRVLAQHGGKYAVGDKLTIADVYLFYLFKMSIEPNAAIEHIPSDLITPYAHITRVYNTAKAHPRVVEWEAKNAAPSAMTVTKPNSLKVSYFDFTGRAEAVRLSFYVAGIEFEDERLTREQFAAIKPTLPFGQVPVLTVDGKHVFAQSKAILHYAGALGGQYPGTSDLFTSLLIDQVVEEIEDIWIKLGPSLFEKDTSKKIEMRQKIATEVYPPMLAALDKVLAKHGGKYAVGDKLTIADLSIYCNFNMLIGQKPFVEHIPNDLLAPYHHITKVFNSVKNHPRVVEWESKCAARQK